MAERQVRQSYREALVQISPTTEKKKGKKETGGALKRVVGECEAKKEKERVGKDEEKTEIEILFY